MSKCIRTVWVFTWIFILMAVGMLAADMLFLHQNLVRFHVVGASDSEEDQAQKLLVKDALVRHLEQLLAPADSVHDAEAILMDNLEELQLIAEQKLSELNSHQTVNVCLTTEAFNERHYETFKLPSGIYKTLRVQIGNAQGENWWCVAFPNLCLPKTVDAFMDDARNCGFNDTMTASLTGQGGFFELHFFLLDCLGKLENLIFSMK